jgi:hypothetical protein
MRAEKRWRNYAESEHSVTTFPFINHIRSAWRERAYPGKPEPAVIIVGSSREKWRYHDERYRKETSRTRGRLWPSPPVCRSVRYPTEHETVRTSHSSGVLRSAVASWPSSRADSQWNSRKSLLNDHRRAFQLGFVPKSGVSSSKNESPIIDGMADHLFDHLSVSVQGGPVRVNRATQERESAFYGGSWGSTGA